MRPSGHFIDYLLERPDVAPVWDRFVNHPFVSAMGDGTLPIESFKGYLIQDYLYLVCWSSRSLDGTGRDGC
jgi:thiaminase